MTGTIGDDYKEFMGIFWKMRVTFTAFQQLLSLVGIVLNGYLVCLFCFSKPFRKLEYYPLALNSFIDLIGAGFITMVYQFMYLSVLYDWNRQDFVFKGAIMQKVHDYYYKNRPVECTWRFLYNIFAQYASGPCLLLLACDRYVAVCWATRARQIMTRTVRRCSCITLTLLLVSIYVFSAARAKYKYDRGIYGCTAMMYRDLSQRVAFDAVFFFALPAIACLLMYISVGLQLIKARSRNTKVRNRNLTISLLVSTVFWITVWTPDVVLVLVEDQFESKSSGKYQRSYTYYVFTAIRDPLYLLHANANPFFILFISRKFQEPVRRWIRLVKAKINYRPPVGKVATSSNSNFTSNKLDTDNCKVEQLG